MTDIGSTEEAVALQAAIVAAPDDNATQLVLADLLLSADDPRGELIVLDNRERESPIDDPELLQRYLVLAAEYTFPRITPVPPLPWGSGGRFDFMASHDDRRYKLAHHRDRIALSADYTTLQTWELAAPAEWTAERWPPVLALVGDAITAGTPLRDLRIPYEANPLPTYDGGPVRGYALPRPFIKRIGTWPTRYGLAPHDYDRWHRLYERLNLLLARGRAAF